MSAWWQVDRILGLYGVGRPAQASSRPLLKTRRESLEQHAEGVLSALLTRLTAAAHDELSETQRVAWLVATYDLAVRNGGHREYFAVFGVGRAAEVRGVFERLGAGVQRQILADAIARHMCRPGETGFVDPLRPELSSAAPDYSDLDGFYRGGHEATSRLLERYILAHVGEFIEVVPS
jgi:hypothetical protein